MTDDSCFIKAWLHLQHLTFSTNEMDLLTTEEALRYLEDILYISATEVPNISDKSVSASTKLSFLAKLISAFLEHEPFQSISLMSQDVTKRHRPSWDEIKHDILLGRGGLCYWLNGFMYALLSALGCDASLTYSTYDVGRYSPNNHLIVFVHDLVTPGSLHLVDVGLGSCIPRAVSLDFSMESEEFTDSFMTYKFQKESDTAMYLLKKVYQDTAAASSIKNVTPEKHLQGQHTTKVSEEGESKLQHQHTTKDSEEGESKLQGQHTTKDSEEGESKLQDQHTTKDSEEGESKLQVSLQIIQKTINKDVQQNVNQPRINNESDQQKLLSPTEVDVDKQQDTKTNEHSSLKGIKNDATSQLVTWQKLYIFNPSVALKSLEPFFQCFDECFTDITRLSTHSSPRAMCWPGGRFLALVNSNLIQELEPGKLTKTRIVDFVVNLKPQMGLTKDLGVKTTQNKTAENENNVSEKTPNKYLIETAAESNDDVSKSKTSNQTTQEVSDNTHTKNNAETVNINGADGIPTKDKTDYQGQVQLSELRPLVEAYAHYFPQFPRQMVQDALKNWIATGSIFPVPPHFA